jgi:hypothetical protein
VLAVWSLENPDISYKQGMHELLGLLFLVLHRDSQAADARESGPGLGPDLGSDLGPGISPGMSPGPGLGPGLGPGVDLGLSPGMSPGPSLGPGLEWEELTGDEMDVEEDACLTDGRYLEHDAYELFDAVMKGPGKGVRYPYPTLSYPTPILSNPYHMLSYPIILSHPTSSMKPMSSLTRS